MHDCLIFNKVSYAYEHQKVIDDVTFALRTGTITTLLGPNGAGKTTIAKLLLNIIKPSSGTIQSNINTIAYSPQFLDKNTSLKISAGDFVKYCSGYRLEHPILDLLFEFSNLKNIKETNFYDLSGGQRQRLVLIAAILKNADLLVLDEPTQYLDIASQKKFYDILAKLKNLGKTIFMISHDLFTVTKSSDQVLCLNNHICCKGLPTHTVVKNMDDMTLYNHNHDHSHL